ncbi:DUF6384 family protein [Pseudomonas sp.]|uniref:DUF6384 family protein n=1 Tax=Pseudomonas sp. TaxID=306 RepID=UPI001B009731|nr:DUF6384 family protein [Pseudomonas sp.]MBO9551169.1 hypothetical protein [Pseudomonas sp.]
MSVPLSEQIGAMGLVDQLRHREMEIQEHLDLPRRRAEVAERIRSYYQNNGIAFEDATIEEGVRLFFSRRLVFEAPTLNLAQRLLVRLNMARGTLLKITVIGAVTVALLLGLNWSENIRAQRETAQLATHSQALQHRQQQMLERLKAVTLPAEDRQALTGWAVQAGKDIASQKFKVAENTLGVLDDYLDYAAEPLTLSLVDRPGVKSGVERCYEAAGCSANSLRGKSWYLIVEALDATGKPTQVPVTSVEDGKTRWADQFGVRVSHDEYQKLRQDKLDDGHISQRVIGDKPANTLALRFTQRTSSNPDMILQW